MSEFHAPTIGMRMVLWYPHADRQADPSPAIVHSRNGNSLTIGVLPKNSMTFRLMHGVLHVDDPRLKKLEDAAISNGGWALLPEDERMQQQLEAAAYDLLGMTCDITLLKERLDNFEKNIVTSVDLDTKPAKGKGK